MDTTYLGVKPNRERNVINMSFWIKHDRAKLSILTTAQGRAFYQSLFSEEIADSVSYVILPLSKDFVPRTAISIIVEYVKRMVGVVLFLRFPVGAYDVIYAITAILPDVLNSYVLKKKITTARSCVVFDNFVKKPQERSGNFLYNVVPYLSYRISLRFLKTFDVVFTVMVGDGLKRAHQMFKDTKTTIVPDSNGVDTEYAARVAPDAPCNDVLFIGRLHRDKGILDLLEVIGRVKKKKPGITVRMIGQMVPDLKDEMQQRIKNLDIESNINISGHVSKLEKYKLLKSARLFCFLSYYESYSVAVLEAMACRLKIFAYDLDIFRCSPFTLGDIKVFQRGEYEKISDSIVDFLQEEQYAVKKEIDLRLIDQATSAQLEYSHF